MQKMNKGEWSEVYALLKILSDGYLKGCYSNLEDNPTSRIPFYYIKQTSIRNTDIFYRPTANGICIRSDLGQTEITETDIDRVANIILSSILDSRNGVFEIDITYFLRLMHNPLIKSPSRLKRDLTIAIVNHGQIIEYGFSVKSNLGSRTSLINASQATNFSFEISQVQPEWIGLKTKELVAEIPIENIRFTGMNNAIYNQNLRKIAFQLPEIISWMLINFFRGESTNVSDLLLSLTIKNPLQLIDTNFYRDKIAALLVTSALGMTPTTEWNGQLNADGGMIIVKKNGEIVTFYCLDIQSMASFQQYLIESCSFETASIKRHKFGTLHQNTLFLNLQIRL